MTTAEKLTAIAENEERVYKAGKRDLMAAVQDYGARTNYRSGFNGWNTDGLYPAYDLIIKGDAGQAFYNLKGEPIDLVARLEECGVTLNIGGATNLGYTFCLANLTHIPEIDTRGANSLSYTFMESGSAVLTTIVNLILREDGSQKFDHTFDGNANLVYLGITGVIGQNGFDVQWASNLSRASIESIINHLSDTTTGLTVTLSKAAVNKAFEMAEGANDGTDSQEWYYLCYDKQNWTISLV